MMRRKWVEDETNEDRWMVSYADFITLLFAFFVVMYAISSVNDEKYRVLSETLAEVFDRPEMSIQPIQVGEPAQTASPNVVDLPDAQGFADQEPGDTHLQSSQSDTVSAEGGFTDAQGISLQSNHDWVELNLDASVLFQPGTATLSAQALQMLSTTLPLLNETTLPVTIEGYTDNVPSESDRYPSNWELSAARASAVARYYSVQGVREDRISAVGYGENHPLATNATPTGRAQNRRVVVVIARRAGLSRNLNANTEQTATTLLRERQAPQTDLIVPIRTAEGGLKFSIDPGE